MSGITANGERDVPATTVFRFTSPGSITSACKAASAVTGLVDSSWLILAITATRVKTVTG